MNVLRDVHTDKKQNSYHPISLRLFVYLRNGFHFRYEYQPDDASISPTVRRPRADIFRDCTRRVKNQQYNQSINQCLTCGCCCRSCVCAMNRARAA